MTDFLSLILPVIFLLFTYFCSIPTHTISYDLYDGTDGTLRSCSVHAVCLKNITLYVSIFKLNNFEKIQIVITGVDYSQKITFEQIKSTLRKSHGQQVIFNPSLQVQATKIRTGLLIAINCQHFTYPVVLTPKNFKNILAIFEHYE